jgi:transposase
MLVGRQKQMSFYDTLCKKIPEDYLLRLIDKAVNFGFVNEFLSDSYRKSFGRPAKEPEMMLTLLLLQRLYDLSDVRVIEEASLNLAFVIFAPESRRGLARREPACQVQDAEVKRRGS